MPRHGAVDQARKRLGLLAPAPTYEVLGADGHAHGDDQRGEQPALTEWPDQDLAHCESEERGEPDSDHQGQGKCDAGVVHAERDVAGGGGHRGHREVHDVGGLEDDHQPQPDEPIDRSIGDSGQHGDEQLVHGSLLARCRAN
jgi:hypothetical protein